MPDMSEDEATAWAIFHPDRKNGLTTIDAIAAALTAARQEQAEADAKVIPTSWLDPLLHGMNIPAGCPDIEFLLRQIAMAIRHSARTTGGE